MNLKTLKDIPQDHPHEMYLDLSSAAREWLKTNPDDYPEEIYTCPKCKKIMESDCEGYNYCFDCDFSCFDIECWIKYFFNLEDE